VIGVEVKMTSDWRVFKTSAFSATPFVAEATVGMEPVRHTFSHLMTRSDYFWSVLPLCVGNMATKLNR
jgi:hypothetical protein